LDVVPEGRGWSFDPFGGQVEDGKLYGRGAADMKGGLAAMLIAAKAIKDSNLELSGELVITCVVDEEETGKGTRHALTKHITADYAIVGEPTSLMVATASKGDINFEIRTIGKAAHSSRPYEGVNAIHKMAKIIHHIEVHNEQLKAISHPLLGHPTISVDFIEGGTTPWIVPENCRIIVDRRTLPGENAETTRRELELLINRIREKDPELITEIRCSQDASASEISQNEKIVQVVHEEISRILRKDAEIVGLSATTDARFLINDAKIPTVIFGPGDISRAHKPDEYVDLNEVQLAAQTYARVALRLLRQNEQA